MAGPLVLPEVGSALPDDLCLLRAVLAAVWRPHGRSDGAGGSLWEAEHRGGQRGRQDIYRDGAEAIECCQVEYWGAATGL